MADTTITSSGRAASKCFPGWWRPEHRRTAGNGKLASGIAGLDALLGGGIEEGTSTLIVGAAGTGKSTLAAQFAAAAAARGQRAAIFVFDENPQHASVAVQGAEDRSRSLISMPGAITVRQVDPAELTPGEFAPAIRNAVGTARLRLS